MATTVQRTTTFPNIASDDTYLARIKKVQDLYAQKFSVFKQKNDKIAALVSTWENWRDQMTASQEITEAMRKDYWEKIGIYILHQTLRDEMKKLLADYETEIAFCQEPQQGLDPTTLEILQRIGVTIPLVIKRYDEIFITKHKELLEQRDALSKLTETFIVSVRNLKLALEPVSRRLSPDQGLYFIPNLLNNAVGRAPYCDVDVKTTKEQKIPTIAVTETKTSESKRQ